MDRGSVSVWGLKSVRKYRLILLRIEDALTQAGGRVMAARQGDLNFGLNMTNEGKANFYASVTYLKPMPNRKVDHSHGTDMQANQQPALALYLSSLPTQTAVSPQVVQILFRRSPSDCPRNRRFPATMGTS